MGGFLRAKAPDAGGYDHQTVEVMRRVLQPHSVGLDLGAHKGDLLAPMVALAPRAPHHAFEPLPRLARSLRQRFPTVTVHQAAVADRPGSSDFVHVRTAPGYSGLRRRVYDTPNPELETIQVAVVTLDGVIGASQPVDFVKIDIEGGEYHALLGGRETILRSRPVIVFEAGDKSTGQYGVTPVQLFDLLELTLGYQLTTMRRWLDGQPPYAREEFCQVWQDGSDWYFLAAPAA